MGSDSLHPPDESDVVDRRLTVVDDKPTVLIENRKNNRLTRADRRTNKSIGKTCRCFHLRC